MVESRKHVCVISANYPTDNDTATYAFLDQLVRSMVDTGLCVDVVAPVSIIKKRKLGIKKKVYIKRTDNGNEYTVHRPGFLSLSRHKVGKLDTTFATNYFFKLSVERELKHIGKVDCLYSHFLSPAGVTAAELGEKYNIPSFCAFGESSLWSIDYMTEETARKKLRGLSGIVSVSSDNKRELTEKNLFPEEKIIVLPNGCDKNTFYPRPKVEMRKQLNLPQDIVIGIFVGAFNERKGILRVQEAVLDIDNVKMIYAGSGSLEPQKDKCLYSGAIQHKDLPLYLSAADFFILPTLAEGCCNAIVEALFCGLPIISSTGSFNDDILNCYNSIRVNPEDISAIRSAVSKIAENQELRNSMRLEALKSVEKLDINERTKQILAFIGVS